MKWNRHLSLTALCIAALGGAASEPAAPIQDRRLLEWVSCPFNTSNARLRVECGRCERFIKFAPQVEPFVTAANKAEAEGR
jgi:hypothetical protein